MKIFIIFFLILVVRVVLRCERDINVCECVIRKGKSTVSLAADCACGTRGTSHHYLHSTKPPTPRIVILACIHIASCEYCCYFILHDPNSVDISLPLPVRCTAPRALQIATISTETDLLIYTVLTLLNSTTL